MPGDLLEGAVKAYWTRDGIDLTEPNMVDVERECMAAALEYIAANVSDEMCVACVSTRDNPYVKDMSRIDQVRVGIAAAIRAASPPPKTEGRE